MDMKAALFPGQGIPAKTVLEALDETGAHVTAAERQLGYPLRSKVAIAARRKGALLPTMLAQPAIFVAGIAAFELAGQDLGFDYFAGHSLGEYAALVAAEAMTFEDALEVVRVRGEAMQAASRTNPGSMAAVMGLELAEVEDIAAQADVTVANDNAPGQVVVAGGELALAEVAKLAGGREGRTVLLEVAGPFHTEAVASAVPDLRAVLDSIDVKTPQAPVISNVTARPYSSPTEIRELLVTQLTSRVRWRESIIEMFNSGVRDFTDFGPGRVAAGLAQRVTRSLTKEAAVGA